MKETVEVAQIIEKIRQELEKNEKKKAPAV